MESQHMSQQVFSDFIGLAPATLSGIFNDRTRPTLNVVELIKKKIPNISTDWLMFGSGPMYTTAEGPVEDSSAHSSTIASDGMMGSQAGRGVHEPTLDFGQMASPTPQRAPSVIPSYNGVRSTHLENVRDEMKYFDKPQRRVTEIRVYYDDQTWESFVPSKK